MSYKIDVAISAHVTDRLHQMELALIQHIPVVPKHKCAMHMTTRYIVKKTSQLNVLKQAH